MKVVCSASCYQLASECLVKVIASEPSEPPMLLFAKFLGKRYEKSEEPIVSMENLKDVRVVEKCIKEIVALISICENEEKEQIL